MTIRELKSKYTKVRRGGTCCHSVWLQIGNQEFNVTPTACDTASEAEWYRTQLARALKTLLAEAKD